MTQLLSIKFLLISLGLFAMICASQVQAIVPKPPEMSSRSYVLIDYDTGKVLAEKNADELIPPSSLTKMMTSYVLSDEVAKGNVSYADLVTISRNAWAQNPLFEGSSLMWIEVGKQVSLEDLKRGIIISSGNDASTAVAEHLAGSESGFAELMNHHASLLGMTNTHFVNSHGLPDVEHLTSARDMAKLAVALIRDFPDDYSVYKERSFTYNGITTRNRNELLWDRSLDVDGIKTGHTEVGGYSLVSSATKDGMRLIAVVMGADSKTARAQQNKRLLNYGFRFYKTLQPVQPGQVLHSQRVWYGDREKVALGLNENVLVTIPRSDEKQLKASFALNAALEAPLAKNAVVGTVSFKIGDELIKQVPLVVLQSVAEGGIWSQFTDHVGRTLDGWFND
jgi:serine-type D-Ala-D-Ala carboxypeptidase (penicillin-binding protein 5/6)